MHCTCTLLFIHCAYVIEFDTLICICTHIEASIDHHAVTSDHSLCSPPSLIVFISTHILLTHSFIIYSLSTCCLPAVKTVNIPHGTRTLCTHASLQCRCTLTLFVYMYVYYLCLSSLSSSLYLSSFRVYIINSFLLLLLLVNNHLSDSFNLFSLLLPTCVFVQTYHKQ